MRPQISAAWERLRPHLAACEAYGIQCSAGSLPVNPDLEAEAIPRGRFFSRFQLASVWLFVSGGPYLCFPAGEGRIVIYGAVTIDRHALQAALAPVLVDRPKPAVDVAPAPPAVDAAPVPADHRPKWTNPAARRWMQDRVKNWPAHRRAPSGDEDLKAARAYFAAGWPRSAFRIVRLEETPEEWRTQGNNRPPWGQVRKTQ